MCEISLILWCETKINQTIFPFAGISFINDAFNRFALYKPIDNQLSISTLSNYQYSEIFRSWFNTFFCEGEYAEDIQQHLHPTLKNIPGNSLPNADTLLRGTK